MIPDRLAHLDIRPYRRRLKSGLPQGERTGFDLKILDSDGRPGLGEVVPLEGFGTEPFRDAQEALKRAQGALAAGVPCPGDLSEVPGCMAMLGVRLDRTPAAYAGLELALLDLLAFRRRQSLATLLAGGHGARTRVEVNALLTGTEPGLTAHDAEQAQSDGFKTIKIKVGHLSLEQALRVLADVRQRVGADIRLRADAGRAWPAGPARAALAAMADLDLEYIEEPCAALEEVLADPGARRLVAADESACPARRGWGWLSHPLRPATMVVKPLLFGGLLEAARFAQAAVEAGSRVVLTSAMEGPVGLAAVAQLAAALPFDLPACGLATAVWEESERRDWLIPRRGGLDLPSDPGVGILVS